MDALNFYTASTGVNKKDKKSAAGYGQADDESAYETDFVDIYNSGGSPDSDGDEQYMSPRDRRGQQQQAPAVSRGASQRRQRDDRTTPNDDFALSPTQASKSDRYNSKFSDYDDESPLSPRTPVSVTANSEGASRRPPPQRGASASRRAKDDDYVGSPTSVSAKRTSSLYPPAGSSAAQYADAQSARALGMAPRSASSGGVRGNGERSRRGTERSAGGYEPEQAGAGSSRGNRAGGGGLEMDRARNASMDEERGYRSGKKQPERSESRGGDRIGERSESRGAGSARSRQERARPPRSNSRADVDSADDRENDEYDTHKDKQRADFSVSVNHKLKSTLSCSIVCAAWTITLVARQG
ncbi:hypothetical protein BC830DRAFT_571189 [Chytriomyces sp. MP71]|nr:hypothetical protein BC830DRAFT_571189 [Chytriomyces sp. MP71]